jgi:hypothetical protein
MSDQIKTNDGSADMQVEPSAQPRVVYTEEGEMLTEVVLPEGPPPDDDDNESVWTATSENVDEFDMDGTAAAAEDMSSFNFRSHTDSVYCVAVHPSRKGVVITGKLWLD